jgi:hypothetical protein
VTASASPPTPRRPLQRWRAREAQFAVTADGIRSDDPSSKLLAPPRPVEAALAPLQLQRWPDAAAAPCADGRLRPYRAAVAHGTKRVHKQASSSCSAVENLQPQQLARSVFFLDCLSRSSRRTRVWPTELQIVCMMWHHFQGQNVVIHTQYCQNFRACGGQTSPRNLPPKPQFTPQLAAPDLS